jgi:lipoyl(octanoyl) transferase
MDELWVCQLGVIDYAEALALQLQLREARQAERLPDVLLLLEHPPVYTRGKRSEPGELPLGEAFYRSQGIDIVETDRGGKLTYHGPGQLVGYPIMRTGDVIAFLRAMERAIIDALAEEGIEAQMRAGLTGVWVENRKIASIGIHLSRGVTTHGFAINVQNDLQPFTWVVPCGLEGVQMTSVARERNTGGLLPCFRKRMAYSFARAYERRQRLVSRVRLERVAGGYELASAATPMPAALSAVAPVITEA